MQDTLPKVTIMIPTYNQEDYIEEAIKSALMQDYPNLEIIVGDDCSTDSTGVIAQKYVSEKLKYFRNESNLGRVGNYHHIAHDLANGDWAVNLDGDDYFTSSTFITDAIKNIQIAKNMGKNVVAYCYKNPNIDKYEKTFSTTRINESCILIKGKDYFLNYYKIRTFGHKDVIYDLKKGKELSLYTLDVLASDFHALIRLFLTGDLLLDKRLIAVWRAHRKNATIVEVEDKQNQAMVTFDAIQQFAYQYCSEEELHTWRKEMNKDSYRDYISTYVHCHKNFKAFILLLTHPHFDKSYLRLWYIFFFRR